MQPSHPHTIEKTEKSCKNQTSLNNLSKFYRKYNKFSPEQLNLLKAKFKENCYPTKEEIRSLATKLGEKIDKLLNWFKHQRKKEVRTGKMKFEKKNSFQKAQIQILEQLYDSDRNPSRHLCEQIAKNLGCKTKNVRNWFSYKRKKSLRLERQQSKASATITIKQEPQSQSMPVTPMNSNAEFMQKSTLFPIPNANNSPILPLVPQPLNAKPQILANYQVLLLNNYLENVRITQEIRLLYGELLKNQQIFKSFKMNWEVLRLLSNNSAKINNN